MSGMFQTNKSRHELLEYLRHASPSVIDSKIAIPAIMKSLGTQHRKRLYQNVFDAPSHMALSCSGVVLPDPPVLLLLLLFPLSATPEMGFATPPTLD
jgi:hypothetical protein